MSILSVIHDWWLMPSQPLPPDVPTWTWSNPCHLFEDELISRLGAENKQLRFLLSHAPMVDAPLDFSLLRASRSKYAYLNPKTVAKYARDLIDLPFVKVAGSPTIYIITSLMPEGQIIYSPDPLPGYEKRLAEFCINVQANVS